MTALLGFFGRLLIAVLFIVSGVNKLADIGGTQAMIASVGLPGWLAVPTGLFEVIAGLALVFGVLTRLFALLLAGFCLAAAFFFHNDLLDPMQAAMALKNVAIAGGLLCLCALDTLRWSYDGLRYRRRLEQEEIAERERLHDREIRAARAEGLAAAVCSRDVSRSEIQGRTAVADVGRDEPI